jgi:hypothetical protein
MLSHADPTPTLRTYTHATQAEHRDVAFAAFGEELEAGESACSFASTRLAPVQWDRRGVTES